MPWGRLSILGILKLTVSFNTDRVPLFKVNDSFRDNNLWLRNNSILVLSIIILLLMYTFSSKRACVVRFNAITGLIMLDLLIFLTFVNPNYLVVISPLIFKLQVWFKIQALLTVSLSIYLWLLVQQLLSDGGKIGKVVHVTIILLIDLMLGVSLAPRRLNFITGLGLHKRVH